MSMPYHLASLCRGLVLACTSVGANTIAAQVDLIAVADAMIESHVPRRDDSDATARQLITAARKASADDVAVFLLSRANSYLAMVREPEAILAALAGFDGPTVTGEVAHEAMTLRRTLLRRLRRWAALRKSEVFAGYANRFTVIGPFGDDGDDYTGVVFPPERNFPGRDQTLAGRYGPVQSRTVARRFDRYLVELRAPLHRRRGCCYALHQVEAEKDTACYLRVWCAGSFSVFVNGRRLATVDTSVKEHTVPQLVPAVLARGHNHVLIKTTTNRVPSFGLRYTNPRGYPLRGIREFAATPTVRPFATDKVTVAPPPVYADAVEHFEAAAARAAGDDRARLLLAAALSVSPARPQKTIQLVDAVRREPPTSPRLRLALAQAIRLTRLVPDEIRRNLARRLVDGIGEALGDHFSLFMHRISHLEDEDQRETAVRRLRQRIRAGKAEPGTFERLSRLYQRLGFVAERRSLGRAWIKACPGDLRPLVSEVGYRRSAGDTAGAMRLARQALRQDATGSNLLAVLDLAMDLGHEDLAVETLDRLYPRDDVPLLRLKALANLRRRSGAEDRFLDLQAKIAARADASIRDLRTAAGHLLVAGRRDRAAALSQRVLAADPSEHTTRRQLWRLDGANEFPDMGRFRVDGGELIRALKPTAREEGAASSLLLDQQIIEVFADGSSVTETHTVRRINDLSGVEQFQSADDAARADEVVLLHTIATDGKSYVPNRVEGGFSMPRLAPGVFIETIYREFNNSPEPGPWRPAKFYFQGEDSPFLRSELVIILPKGSREPNPASFRLRNFKNAPVVERLASGKTVHIYRVDDSPRLPTEFAPPPTADIVPTLAFGEDRSPAQLARRLRANALRRNVVTPVVTRKASALVAGLANDHDKALAIHEFVNREIVTARASTSPTSILMLKKGPRFFLELALLEAAGIPFRHGLCAGRSRALRRAAQPFYQGEVPYRLPCARIEPRGAKPMWLFVDSPRFFPLGEIPSERLAAEVMLADPHETTQLPTGDLRRGHGLEAVGELTLDANGEATMDLTLQFRGVSGYGYAEGIRNQVENRRTLIARNLLGQMMRGWSLVDAKIIGLDAHGPLVVRGTLRRRQALKPAGTDFLLPLPMLPSALLSAWGGRAERTLALHLFTVNAMSWRITVDPGKAFAIADVPPPAAAAAKLLAFELNYERRGNKVVITRDVLQSPGSLAPTKFGEWRALLKRLDEAERANIKLKSR